MDKKILFFLVIALNILGAIYGFVFYYGEAFLQTNPLLWIFVPDCPLYALLMAVVLILIYLRRQFNLLYFLAFAGALKYGFWTVFVLSIYPQFYFTPQSALTYSILFVAHIGLVLEITLLSGKIRLKKWFLIPALFWFLLNDFVDYLLQTHPPLPSGELQFMFNATIAMSFIFTFLSYVLVAKIKKPLINFF